MDQQRQQDKFFDQIVQKRDEGGINKDEGSASSNTLR